MTPGIFSINDTVYVYVQCNDTGGSAADATVGPTFDVWEQGATPALLTNLGMTNRDTGFYVGSSPVLVAAGFEAGKQYCVRVEGTVDGETPAVVMPFMLLADGHSLEEQAGLIDHLDADITSRSSHTAANVWAVGTRTLSSFGTLIADIWHQLLTGITTASTIGKLIKDYLDQAISTTESNIRGTDSDDLKDLSGQIDGLPVATDYTAARAASLDHLNADIDSRQPSGAVNLIADQSAATIGTVDDLGEAAWVKTLKTTLNVTGTLYFCSSSGDDGNSGLTPTLAKAQPATCAGLASAGDAIYILPGTIDIGTNVVILPDGVNLFGGGRSVSILQSATAGSAHGVLVNPGNGSIIKSLRIYASGATGLPLGAFGAGQSSFTGVLIEDVDVEGVVDGFYLTGFNDCSGIIRRSHFKSTYDGIAVYGAANRHQFIFEDCLIEVVNDGTCSYSRAVVMAFNPSNGADTYYTFRNCQLVARQTGGTPRPIRGIDVTQGVVVLVEGGIVRASGGSSNYDLRQASTARLIVAGTDYITSSGTITRCETIPAEFTANAKGEIESEATDALNAYAPPTKTEMDNKIDALVNLSAADVWDYATRTLSSFGTLVADVTTAVWAAGTRTLTSFGTLVADIWANTTRTLTDFAAVAEDVWDHLTSAITTVGSIGKHITDNLDTKVSTVGTGGGANAVTLTITDADANPIPQANIVIRDSGGSIVQASGTTNASGQKVFALDNGTY